MSSGDGISGCIFLGEELLATTSFDGLVEVWDVASGLQVIYFFCLKYHNLLTEKNYKRWLTCEKYFVTLRTGHMNAHSNKITGCDVSPDRKLFATVSLDLNLKVKPRKKIYLILNYTVLKYSSFMWLYSGVVSAEEHRSGLSHESLPPELCELWPWGSARGSGMLGWSRSFVELAWTEKRYGEGMTPKIRYALYTKTYNFSSIQTLLGHQSSVRSLSFSPCSSMLCSGCLSGEVRLWSVTGAACVGSYHAHRGSNAVTKRSCREEPLAERRTWTCGEGIWSDNLQCYILLQWFTHAMILTHSVLIEYFCCI